MLEIKRSYVTPFFHACTGWIEKKKKTVKVYEIFTEIYDNHKNIIN